MKNKRLTSLPIYWLSVVCIVSLLSSCNQNKSKAITTDYSDIISLYKEFDQLRRPKIVSGIPDYSAVGMSHQFDRLKILQAKLSRMDTAGWTKDQQIDYRLMESANGVVAAIIDFRIWLEEKLTTLTGSSGIGVENYDWLLKNVYLSP